MHRENSFYALAIGNSADGKRFIKSAAFAANHNTGKYLDSFLVPFYDPGVNAHAVADGKLRRLAFLLFFLNGINNYIHSFSSGAGPPWRRLRRGRANIFPQHR